MKDWIFISDFDNTMSEKDFYHIVIDGYIGQEAVDFYKNTKAAYDQGARIGIDFLNKILGWRKFSRSEHDEMLDLVAIDQDSKAFYKFIQSKEGDFLILSAGFDYYIHETLKRNGMEDVPVITNPGVFERDIFEIRPDVKSLYYSELYGIDKGLVVKDFQSKYKKVYFYGDSEPDYHAAIHADVVFAKDELYEMMTRHNKSCYHVDSYKDIMKIMKDMTI